MEDQLTRQLKENKDKVKRIEQQIAQLQEQTGDYGADAAGSETQGGAYKAAPWRVGVEQPNPFKELNANRSRMTQASGAGERRFNAANSHETATPADSYISPNMMNHPAARINKRKTPTTTVAADVPRRHEHTSSAPPSAIAQRREAQASSYRSSAKSTAQFAAGVGRGTAI